MFKLRRRAGAAVAGSDLPYCGMCQQPMRVDAVSGRCALGHPAAAPLAPPLAAEPVVAADSTEVLEPGVQPAEPFAYGDEVADPYDTIVYGRSDYDFSNDETATWEAPAASASAALEEYATWGEPADGFSALDVDTAQLPAVPAEAATPAQTTGDMFDDFDDVDDATHARRKAVGTIGATIGVSGLVLASVAALPF